MEEEDRAPVTRKIGHLRATAGVLHKLVKRWGHTGNDLASRRILEVRLPDLDRGP